MDSLPQEVISHVASFLPKRLSKDGPLIRPNIASVSRRWQSVIEPLIFDRLKIKHTEIDELASVFSDAQSHRRTLLRDLNVSIILPTYSDEDCAAYETRKDRAANDKVASQAISGLFKVLSSWGSDRAIGIKLVMEIYSPMDKPHRGWEKYQEDKFQNEIGRRQDLFEDRYKYSYIRITNPDKLPEVACVTSAVYPSSGFCRSLHPGSQVALTAKTPTIEKVKWELEEPGVYLVLRREMRDEFIQSLQTFQLAPSTRVFDVQIGRPIYQHRHRLPDLVSPHERDPLSSALHRVIGTGEGLKEVNYTGQVDEALFWPYSEGEEPPRPLWSSVTRLTVQFWLESPRGRWYFRGRPDDDFNVPSSDEPLPLDTVEYLPPGYYAGDDDGSEHSSVLEAEDDALEYEKSMRPVLEEGDGTYDSRNDFRTVPNDEVMIPLLKAFARATAQMSSLEEADLMTSLEDNGEWFVWYRAPGVEAGYEEYMEGEGDPSFSQPRVFFHVNEWRPSEEVIDLFKEIGRKMHQKDTVVTFLPYLW